mmetsp:Transcript_97611/g.209440  ORF Transcript_97611/g.209440 Transcript_97611/m.209440 type:complete len:215 (+) Transcript_97611:114-758(+)
MPEDSLAALDDLLDELNSAEYSAPQAKPFDGANSGRSADNGGCSENVAKAEQDLGWALEQMPASLELERGSAEAEAGWRAEADVSSLPHSFSADPLLEERENLDDLLDDVLNLDTSPAPPKPSPVASPVLVASTELQCLGCDFQVILFRSATWSPQAEYLFFRNYYPEDHKLREMLVASPHHDAYCCQCTWKSSPIGASPSEVSADTRWKVVQY